MSNDRDPAAGSTSDPSIPHGSAFDFLALRLREQAEADRRAERERKARAERKAEWHRQVDGPIEELRPEWKAACDALDSLLARELAVIQYGPAAAANLVPAPTDVPAVAATLERIGRSLARLDAVRAAEAEMSERRLREAGLPPGGPSGLERPVQRLAAVRNCERFQAQGPRAAAELLLRAADTPDMLAGHLELMLRDDRLRVGCGWLRFILHKLLWPEPPGIRVEQGPTGPGEHVTEQSERVRLRDCELVSGLLAGNHPQDDNTDPAATALPSPASTPPETSPTVVPRVATSTMCDSFPALPPPGGDLSPGSPDMHSHPLPDAPVLDRPSSAGDGPGVSKCAMAIAVLAENPNIDLAELARRIGAKRGALYAKLEFERFRTVARGLGKMTTKGDASADLPRGSKDKDGRIEAEDH